VLALALLVAAGLVWRAHFQQALEQTKAETARSALGALLDADPAVDKASREKLARALGEWREELHYNRSRAPEEYNLPELAKSLRDSRVGPVGKADAPIRQQALERLQALFSWMNAAMQRYNRGNPLTVSELSGTAPKEIKVFAGADHRLYFAEGGAVRQRNWADVKPSVLGAVVVGALLGAETLPPREVVQGAQVFAYFYNLPEMNETLRRGRVAREQQ
jgi:hypothetical protein